MTFENVIKDYSWVTRVFKVAIWAGPLANLISGLFFVSMFTNVHVPMPMYGYMNSYMFDGQDLGEIESNSGVALLAVVMLIGFLIIQGTSAWLANKWLGKGKFTHAGFAGLVLALFPSILGGVLQLIVLVCAIILLVDPDKFVAPKSSDGITP
jgi:hypothetical protein